MIEIPAQLWPLHHNKGQTTLASPNQNIQKVYKKEKKQKKTFHKLYSDIHYNW